MERRCEDAGIVGYHCTGRDGGGFFGPEGSKKQLKAAALWNVVRTYGKEAPMGKSDRNPPDEDSDEAFGGRKEPGRNPYLYEGYLCGIG